MNKTIIFITLCLILSSIECNKKNLRGIDDAVTNVSQFIDGKTILSYLI